MNSEITREDIEALRKLMISGTPDVEANPLNQVLHPSPCRIERTAKADCGRAKGQVT